MLRHRSRKKILMSWLDTFPPFFGLLEIFRCNLSALKVIRSLPKITYNGHWHLKRAFLMMSNKKIEYEDF